MQKRKPRRSPAKTAWLRVRVTEAQLEAMDRAAEARGLDLSAWVRDVLVEAVIARTNERRGIAP